MTVKEVKNQLVDDRVLYGLVGDLRAFIDVNSTLTLVLRDDMTGEILTDEDMMVSRSATLEVKQVVQQGAKESSRICFVWCSETRIFCKLNGTRKLKWDVRQIRASRADRDLPNF